MKKHNTLGVLFCIALLVFLSACNKDEGLRGTYKWVDGDDTLWFEYTSKVQVNLDGEILEGTFRIDGDTILVTINDSERLIVFTQIDEKTLLRRHSSLQVFTKR